MVQIGQRITDYAVAEEMDVEDKLDEELDVAVVFEEDEEGEEDDSGEEDDEEFNRHETSKDVKLATGMDEDLDQVEEDRCAQRAAKLPRALQSCLLLLLLPPPLPPPPPPPLPLFFILPLR